ncbi:MAG: hypothetical protein ACRC3Y_03690 [Romboutsia sp.]|uniref:hypothetical protein n=1 Tax=Romboutsia sp. TaxID=1965302 RepID=UPI003F3708CC
MNNMKNPFDDYVNPFDPDSCHKINNTNTDKLKEKYSLTFDLIDNYVTEVLSQGKYTIEELEEYIKAKGHQVYNVEVIEPKQKRIFDTTQNTVVVPTNELIKIKGSDFRVLLGLSTISNVDDTTKSGANNRYVSLKKVDRNMKILCEQMNISPSQFKKHMRTLLKSKSDEFKIVDREFNGNIVKCYEINYVEGGFITIPYAKVEKLIIGLSNNCIKLYSNLLWLCQKDGRFIDKHISQELLLELMGLSKNSDKTLKIVTETLEECKLIKTEKVWESETILNDEGLPIGSSPKSKIYYSIVTE